MLKSCTCMELSIEHIGTHILLEAKQIMTQTTQSIVEQKLHWLYLSWYSFCSSTYFYPIETDLSNASIV